MELTLPKGNAATGGEDAYVRRDAEGNITHRPLEGLSPIDRMNARAYEGTKHHTEQPEICDWFTNFTGTRQLPNGRTVVNSLYGYGWIKTMKGFWPTSGSDLLAYAWEEGEDGKKHPVGEALGYRLWTIIPTLDLSKKKNVEAFDSGAKDMTFSLLPVSSAIGVKREDIVAEEKYQTPRLMYKNVVLVDYKTNEDGSISPTRCRANYYLRMQFKNRDLPQVPYVNGAGDTKFQQAYIFAGITMRKMADVTAEFMAVYDQVEGSDTNERVHVALAQFFINPELASTKLARILQLQARSLAGAHVDALPGGQGTPKYDYNLVDRCCLYATEVRDCYHGVERTIEGKNAEDEFLDFHGRLMRIQDPLALNAQRLAGKSRLNDGVKVVLSD